MQMHTEQKPFSCYVCAYQHFHINPDREDIREYSHQRKYFFCLVFGSAFHRIPN